MAMRYSHDLWRARKQLDLSRDGKVRLRPFDSPPRVRAEIRRRSMRA